eukprot:366101-Chlamydomonas_euryale.AAC.14
MLCCTAARSSAALRLAACWRRTNSRLLSGMPAPSLLLATTRTVCRSTQPSAAATRGFPSPLPPPKDGKEDAAAEAQPHACGVQRAPQRSPASQLAATTISCKPTCCDDHLLQASMLQQPSHESQLAEAIAFCTRLLVRRQQCA